MVRLFFFWLINILIILVGFTTVKRCNQKLLLIIYISQWFPNTALESSSASWGAIPKKSNSTTYIYRSGAICQNWYVRRFVRSGPGFDYRWPLIFEICVPSLRWMLQHLNVIVIDDYRINNSQCWKSWEQLAQALVAAFLQKKEKKNKIKFIHSSFTTKVLN